MDQACSLEVALETVILDRVAAIDDMLCDGCRKCMLVCTGGMTWAPYERLVLIDPFLCDGCGDCVEACPQGAMRMLTRSAG